MKFVLVFLIFLGLADGQPVLSTLNPIHRAGKAPLPPTANLVFWSDGSGSGSTLSDKSTSANSATITNGTLVSTGLSLNGTNARALTNSAALPTVSGGITIIAAIKPSTISPSGNYGSIFTTGSDTTSGDVAFNIKITGQFGFNAWIGSWQSELNSGNVLTANQWATVAVTRTNGVGGILYLNGQEIASDLQTYTLAGNSDQGLVGAQTVSAPSVFFPGIIGGVLVYNAPLTRYQILQAHQYLQWLITGKGASFSPSPKWLIGPGTILSAAGGSGTYNARIEEADGYLDAGGTYRVNFSCWNNSAGSGSTAGSIAQASGPSFQNLTNNGQILQASVSGWDSGYVSGARTYYEAGTYYLYYFGATSASFEATPASIGVATASAAGGPYIKYSGNPILSPTLTAEGNTVYRPFVLKSGSTYYLFYNAQDGHGIFVATAPSPLGPFAKVGTTAIVPGTASWASSRVGDPAVYYDTTNSQWVMYCFGDTDSTGFHGIGRWTSPDLATWTVDASNPVEVGYIRPSLTQISGRWLMLADDIGKNLYILSSPVLR